MNFSSKQSHIPVVAILGQYALTVMLSFANSLEATCVNLFYSFAWSLPSFSLDKNQPPSAITINTV